MFILYTQAPSCALAHDDVLGWTPHFRYHTWRNHELGITKKHYTATFLQEVQDLFQAVTIYPIDETISTRFATTRVKLFDLGRPVPSSDLWIAATALEYNLTLVTHNTRDFYGIPDLRLVDWLLP